MRRKLLTVLICCALLVIVTGCEEEQKESQQPETKPTIKINLNDNIEVAETMYATLCGGWYFTTNAEEVFSEGIIDNGSFKVIDVGGIIAPHEWEENVEKLTFDENKEEKAKTEFAKINVDNQLGIAKYTSKFTNHEFYYEYYALELANPDKHPEIHDELQATLNNFQSQFTEIFSENGAYLKKGACGGAAVTVTLSEELCTTYNLNCDRW